MRASNSSVLRFAMSARFPAAGWALACVLALPISVRGGDADRSWALVPLERPHDAQPIISPLKDSTFQNPIDQKPAHWEALHTFNPGAVVRDGKIYVLYRAEDDSGQMKIGGHTSRVGLAVSEDGIHFQREAAPVLYPAADDQQAREWPGGVEDPRVIEAEDGTYVVPTRSGITNVMTQPLPPRPICIPGPSTDLH